MEDVDFDFLRDFLYRRSGLSLTREKRYLVESRLGILCRTTAIASIGVLTARLRQGDRTLERAVVEAMTTNETLFFRDRSPFDLFRNVILPEKLARNAARRSLRIWCAAVSSGQEAYSLAMILDEMSAQLAGWTIEILGTDISLDMLERAKAGRYSQFEIQRGLPVQLLLRHFQQDGDKWLISEKIRDMVSLKQHNLLEPSEHLGQFDAIFCRNVLIYFDVATKARVLNQLALRLAHDGVVVLGAAETVIGITTTIAPDARNSGLYRDGRSAKALSPELTLPERPRLPFAATA